VIINTGIVTQLRDTNKTYCARVYVTLSYQRSSFSQQITCPARFQYTEEVPAQQINLNKLPAVTTYPINHLKIDTLN